jgi:hypothetical protein
MPSTQEEDDLPILLAGQICLIAHVGDRHLIVRERAFSERSSVMAGATIELV